MDFCDQSLSKLERFGRFGEVQHCFCLKQWFQGFIIINQLRLKWINVGVIIQNTGYLRKTHYSETQGLLVSLLRVFGLVGGRDRAGGEDVAFVQLDADPTGCGFKFWTKWNFSSKSHGSSMVKATVMLQILMESYNFHDSKHMHSFPVALT